MSTSHGVKLGEAKVVEVFRSHFKFFPENSTLKDVVGDRAIQKTDKNARPGGQ